VFLAFSVTEDVFDIMKAILTYRDKKHTYKIRYQFTSREFRTYNIRDQFSSRKFQSADLIDPNLKRIA